MISFSARKEHANNDHTDEAVMSPSSEVGPPQTSPADNSQALFTFPAGDIDILVTYQGKPVTGKVSSHALILGSAVWAKFASPPWNPLAALNQPGSAVAVADSTSNEDLIAKATYSPDKMLSDGNEPSNSEGKIAATEAKPTPLTGKEEDPIASKTLIQLGVTEKTMATELHFEDDDGDALLLLLRIAHLQFAQVPTSLSFSQLLQVAILCDMYDCATLVKPWLSGWLSDEVAESKRIGQEDWLFSAWVFRREQVFEELAKKLVREVRTNGKDCLTSSGAVLSNLVPEGLLGAFYSTSMLSRQIY